MNEIIAALILALPGTQAVPVYNPEPDRWMSSLSEQWTHVSYNYKGQNAILAGVTLIKGEKPWPHNVSQCGRFDGRILKNQGVIELPHNKLAIVNLSDRWEASLHLWYLEGRWYGKSVYTDRVKDVPGAQYYITVWAETQAGLVKVLSSVVSKLEADIEGPERPNDAWITQGVIQGDSLIVSIWAKSRQSFAVLSGRWWNHNGEKNQIGRKVTIHKGWNRLGWKFDGWSYGETVIRGQTLLFGHSWIDRLYIENPNKKEKK